MLEDAKGYIDPRAVSDWFWEIIHKAHQNQERLKALLSELSRREVDIFYDEFRKEAWHIVRDCYDSKHLPRYPTNLTIFAETVHEILREKCFDERELAYPDAAISDWSWEIISKAERSREKLEAILRDMTLEQIYTFQLEFVNASVELRDDIFVQYLGEYSSDDSVQDITWWIVSQGKDYFYRIWENPELIAEAEECVNGAEILYGVAYDIYEEKGGNILDLPFG